MLRCLFIKNYTLIDELSIDFNRGFSTITGETGAGKSIILGALGLVLGQRNQQKIAKDAHQKTIIEVNFDLRKYDLQNFFEINDWDYQTESIISRMIMPNGKSRAFINDIPVKITDLQKLGGKLIDIHGQHDNRSLDDKAYSYSIFDCLANQLPLVQDYQTQLNTYRKKQKEINQLIEEKKEKEKEQGYHQHLYEELNNANLKAGEQAPLEQQIQRFHHQSDLINALSENIAMMENEQGGALEILHQLMRNTENLTRFDPNQKGHLQRLESIKIEMADITNDWHQKLETYRESAHIDIESLEARMRLLWDLTQKHQVSDSDELLAIRDELSEKITAVDHYESRIADLATAIANLAKNLDSMATTMMNNRQAAVKPFVKHVTDTLAKLGMKNTCLSVNMNPQTDFNQYGKQDLSIQIAANEGLPLGHLKTLSGGEQSRVMFAIKSLLSEKINLPTLIFDEIDTGVSGEVALKMGNIMKAMGKRMQVLSITHLPQVAAKGTWHYQVKKETINKDTQSRFEMLDDTARIHTIAEMLSGKHPQETAIAHAKKLLED